MKKLFSFIFVILVCGVLNADPISFVQVRRTLQPGTTNQGVFVGSGTIQNLTASTVTLRNVSMVTVSVSSITAPVPSGVSIATAAFTNQTSFLPSTNQLIFGSPAGNRWTLNAPAPISGNMTVTLPTDTPGSAAFVLTDGDQSIGGAKTFTGFGKYNAGISISTGGTSTPIFQMLGSSTSFIMNGSSMVVITPSDVAIKGLASPASTGYRGNLVSTFTVRSAAVSLANGVSKNVFQFTLQPGIYDAFVQCGFVGTGASTALDCALATTTATLPGADVIAVPTTNQGRTREPGLSVATADATLHIYVPINITVATPFFLVSNCEFPSGTCTAYGSINFRKQ